MTKKLREIFNEFFANAVPNLNIPEFTGNFDQPVTVVSGYPIINAIAKSSQLLPKSGISRFLL